MYFLLVSYSIILNFYVIHIHQYFLLDECLNFISNFQSFNVYVHMSQLHMTSSIIGLEYRSFVVDGLNELMN